MAEKEVKGAVYSMVEFNGKLLASINSTVRPIPLGTCVCTLGCIPSSTEHGSLVSWGGVCLIVRVTK